MVMLWQFQEKLVQYPFKAAYEDAAAARIASVVSDPVDP